MVITTSKRRSSRIVLLIVGLALLLVTLDPISAADNVGITPLSNTNKNSNNHHATTEETFSGHRTTVTTTSTTSSSTTGRTRYPHHRQLPGNDFGGLDFNFDQIETAEIGLLVIIVILIALCLLCCCCKNCSLWDLLALYCCWEICCDDTPGCFVPMDDAGMC